MHSQREGCGEEQWGKEAMSWLLPSGVYKRQTLAIYPLSVTTSILEGKQEAECKCRNWSPPISYLRKYKGKAVIGMLREAHFFLPQEMQTEGQL